MIVINGLGVSEGIAIGNLSFRSVIRSNISRRYMVEDVDAEVSRYLSAKKAAHAKLDEMYASTLKHCGEREAEIFRVHKMMIEDDDYQEDILNLTKQERWMAAHEDRVRALMIGVGAAFDYEAGNIQRAPQWMQKHNLEWLYRLLQDPKRLFKRYFDTNLRYLWWTWRR